MDGQMMMRVREMVRARVIVSNMIRVSVRAREMIRARVMVWEIVRVRARVRGPESPEGLSLLSVSSLNPIVRTVSSPGPSAGTPLPFLISASS
jgi:hypothetical protein